MRIFLCKIYQIIGVEFLNVFVKLSEIYLKALNSWRIFNSIFLYNLNFMITRIIWQKLTELFQGSAIWHDNQINNSTNCILRKHIKWHPLRLIHNRIVCSWGRFFWIKFSHIWNCQNISGMRNVLKDFINSGFIKLNFLYFYVNS